VNAILHELLMDPPEGHEHRYNSQGKLLGELCQTFDPYEHEIDDLEPLKRLDQALFDEGLPHFVEILGIERLVESIPMDAKRETATRLVRALEQTRRRYEDDWDFLSQAFDAYGAPHSRLLRDLRDVLGKLGQADNLKQAIGMVADLLDDVRRARYDE
jgi:hypothetical protein